MQCWSQDYGSYGMHHGMNKSCELLFYCLLGYLVVLLCML